MRHKAAPSSNRCTAILLPAHLNLHTAHKGVGCVQAPGVGLGLYPSLTAMQTCTCIKHTHVWSACRHLGWAAQWLEFEAELRANLSRPALTVPVFEDAVRRRLGCLVNYFDRHVICLVTTQHASLQEGSGAAPCSHTRQGQAVPDPVGGLKA